MTDPLAGIDPAAAAILRPIAEGAWLRWRVLKAKPGELAAAVMAWQAWAAENPDSAKAASNYAEAVDAAGWKGPPQEFRLIDKEPEE